MCVAIYACVCSNFASYVNVCVCASLCCEYTRACVYACVYGSVHCVMLPCYGCCLCPMCIVLCVLFSANSYS